MEREAEIEELVLKECILSATGLSGDNLQVGIRGDPSLRETTFQRKKYQSDLDRVFDALEPHLEELMLRRSTYRLYIGFNNGEIRTNSVFDPFRIEIHTAEKLCNHAYIERHFPEITYDNKINVIRNIYKSMDDSGVYDSLPEFWRRIIAKRNAFWSPIQEDEIINILSTLRVLRDVQEYYLRNISICIIQGVIHIQFNCDGTQLIRSGDFEKFLAQNLPN
jgi:hypothetical protein